MKTLLAFLLLASTAFARDYPATITRVVDGDTVVATVDLGFGVQLREQFVRLANANAPEKNTPAGVVSRGWLAVQVDGKKCVLSTSEKTERDKYGLARLSIAGVDLGERAKAEGYAHGGPGRKDPPR